MGKLSFLLFFLNIRLSLFHEKCHFSGKQKTAGILTAQKRNFSEKKGPCGHADSAKTQSFRKKKAPAGMLMDKKSNLSKQIFISERISVHISTDIGANIFIFFNISES